MAKIKDFILTINFIEAIEKYSCLKIPGYARKYTTEKA